MKNEDYEIPEEEHKAFMEWWDKHIPKQYVTILLLQKYKAAQEAINVIISIFEKEIKKYDDSEIEVKVEFDALFGTDLGLTIIVPDIGIQLNPDEISVIYDKLQRTDYILSIIPMLHERISINFTFRNVKEIIDYEDPEEKLPDSFFDDEDNI